MKSNCVVVVACNRKTTTTQHFWQVKKDNHFDKSRKQPILVRKVAGTYNLQLGKWRTHWLTSEQNSLKTLYLHLWFPESSETADFFRTIRDKWWRRGRLCEVPHCWSPPLLSSPPLVMRVPLNSSQCQVPTDSWQYRKLKKVGLDICMGEFVFVIEVCFFFFFGGVLLAAAQLILKHIFVRFQNKFSISLSLSLDLSGLVRTCGEWLSWQIWKLFLRTDRWTGIKK